MNCNLILILISILIITTNSKIPINDYFSYRRTLFDFIEIEKEYLNGLKSLIKLEGKYIALMLKVDKFEKQLKPLGIDTDNIRRRLLKDIDKEIIGTGDTNEKVKTGVGAVAGAVAGGIAVPVGAAWGAAGGMTAAMFPVAVGIGAVGGAAWGGYKVSEGFAKDRTSRINQTKNSIDAKTYDYTTPCIYPHDDCKIYGRTPGKYIHKVLADACCMASDNKGVKEKGTWDFYYYCTCYDGCKDCPEQTQKPTQAPTKTKETETPPQSLKDSKISEKE